MADIPYQADLERTSELLRSWIARRAGEEGQAWLDDKRAQIAGGAPDWRFYTAFSAVPRYLGKADLDLSGDDLDAAAAVRAGWRPEGWSVDQAGRTLLLLALPHDDVYAWLDRLDQLFSTADVGESVALYQSLPLLPYPERLRDRAAEGIRTNMTSVFDAIALGNPFTEEYLDEPAWNQMVLKALFVGTPLHPVRGLDRRANADLARMLVDYAHERWAAHRSVSPELWRPVGPFAEGDVVDDLRRVLEDDDPTRQEAGALALSQSPDPHAKEVLDTRPDLRDRIARGDLTWDALVENRLALS